MNVGLAAYPVSATVLLTYGLINRPMQVSEIPQFSHSLAATVNLHAQIFYLSMALLVFALGMTFLAFRSPRGAQPATYGHIQSIANALDLWAPDMTLERNRKTTSELNLLADAWKIADKPL